MPFFSAVAGWVEVDERSRSEAVVEGREIIPWLDRVSVCSNSSEDVHKP